MINLSEMTKEQLIKADFVRNELRQTLCRCDASIVTCVYSVTSEGEEIVDIIYDNHYHRSITVTCDSLIAIMLDVAKAICY